MKNIEKAKDLIYASKQICKPDNIYIEYDFAIKAIEIAAEPDWFYVEKNELPEGNDWVKVWALLKNNEFEDVLYFDTQNKTFQKLEGAEVLNFFVNDVIAWTYLPTFNPKKP